MTRPAAHWLIAFVGCIATLVGLSACKTTLLHRASPRASPNLQSVLHYPRETPNSEILSKLTIEDGKVALEIYKQKPRLIDRRGLVWVLGYAGDAEAVQVLIHSLTNEFNGKRLTSMEGDEETDVEYVLFNMVTALGLLAAKSDAAHNFLVKGTEFSFWRENQRWQSHRKEDSLRMLVGYSIDGLGVSGRPEARQFMEQLKLKDREYVSKVGGNVVEAVFNDNVIKKYGTETFRKEFLGEQNFRWFMEWSKTVEGKEWRAWSR